MNRQIESMNLGMDAADRIAQKLRAAILINGKASLMVSGGASPKPVYERLSRADLDWRAVTIGLVDERWVEPGQAGSNETFIRENLLQNAASAAQFVGMKTHHATPQEGIETLTDNFKDCQQPFDVCVMGMGLDGHTASWFPNSNGLKAAMSASNPNIFCAIDAQGCEGAGAHTQRMSLTLSAVLAAHDIILFIPGEPKRALYTSGEGKSQLDMPVNALRDAGRKLCVFMSKP